MPFNEYVYQRRICFYIFSISYLRVIRIINALDIIFMQSEHLPFRQVRFCLILLIERSSCEVCQLLEDFIDIGRFYKSSSASFCVCFVSHPFCKIVGIWNIFLKNLWNQRNITIGDVCHLVRCCHLLSWIIRLKITKSFSKQVFARNSSIGVKFSYSVWKYFFLVTVIPHRRNAFKITEFSMK